ncbi:MFS transporter [Actinophytocola algeriensis]|uniref:Putative MFS family arabinose efflux permease n=1 Tax=Actinophytocola algeriensis TaxID=1768010 RepID=A0A7W7Q4A3_9PSEU|nr:MFS transporter [Actinophytocola algeriensis]MBB4906607.1 putative MFS family arabinose efflux permease [Actinophytocola algeriensis]MBE1478088.1 putative MFS family arabinose efflux permease [Actinophytocola algeriensis]
MRFFDETVAYLPYAAVESIRADVDLTYAQAGFLLFLYPGIGLLTTPFGVLVDRCNRRVLAAIGGLGYGVGLFLFAAAGDFWALFVAVCVMGTLGDLLVTAGEVSLVEIAGDNAEPALARANLLAAMGDLAGPLLLATALWSGLGWRAAFWAAGVMMVAYGVLLATRPLPRPEPDDEESAFGALMSVIRDRRVIAAGLLVAVIVAFDDTFIGFAVAFLITDQDLSPALATVATGAGLTGGVAAAAWASRTTRRRVGLRTCAVALTAGVFLLVLVPTTVTAAIAMALVGAAVNLAWIILQARYMTLRPGQAGATSSVAEAVAQIGVTTPLVIGLLADHTGLGPAMWLYCAIAVVFIASAR